MTSLTHVISWCMGNTMDLEKLNDLRFGRREYMTMTSCNIQRHTTQYRDVENMPPIGRLNTDYAKTINLYKKSEAVGKSYPKL